MSADHKDEFNARIYNGNARGLDSYIKKYPGIDLDMLLGGKPVLSRASREGHFEIVKVLLDNGANPDLVIAPFYSSALQEAAKKQQLEIMKLLVKHGADPNAGRPLLGGIISGELAVVRLLVESGSDIHQIYDNEFTALGFAEQQGHAEIAEYLRGLGALTSREALKKRKAEQPSMLSRLGQRLGFGSESSDATEQIVEFFEDSFCQSRPLDTKEIFGRKAPVDIHIIYPSAKSKNLVMFTTGMSAQKMNVGPKELKFARAELYIELSSTWPPPMEGPSFTWPLEWLVNIGEYPKRTKRALGGKHTIIANGEPPEPFSESTGYSCWLLNADRTLKPDKSPYPEPIQFYRLFPLFEEERSIEQQGGIKVLMDSLREARISRTVVPSRINVGV